MSTVGAGNYHQRVFLKPKHGWMIAAFLFLHKWVPIPFSGTIDIYLFIYLFKEDYKL